MLLQSKVKWIKSCSKLLTLVLFAILMPTQVQAQAARITDPVILQKGMQLFVQNCAACHGQNAQGLAKDWKQPGADGRYPPPPLNGTAHTWHHSAKSLVNTIQNGTISIGGNMPAWKGKLSKKDSLHIVIWLTSLWPNEIYQAWWKRNK
jgi:mono/diheme cytochrome c family protein